jgi:hypothetical protein
MDEAALCDRIALIQGAILKIDTPTNIISNYDKTIYNVRTRNTQINSGFKRALQCSALVSTFIISIKCVISIQMK